MRTSTSYKFRNPPGDFLLDTIGDMEWAPTRRTLERTITLSLADYPTNEEARRRMEQIAESLGFKLQGWTKVIGGRWVQEVHTSDT